MLRRSAILRLPRINYFLQYSTTTTENTTKPPIQEASELVKTLAHGAPTPVIQQKLSGTDAAKLIFSQVWTSLEKELGRRENMRFPQEIIWLMGAPGSGKGTNTPAILKARGITNEPIVMSRLLQQPDTRKLIDRGEMVGDKLIMQLLLRALMRADPNVGVLVDGFPRTEVQVECLKLLYDKFVEMQTQFSKTPLRDKFRRPIFRITVLYVDETESLKRQITRGKRVRHHNQHVIKTQQGELLVERVTDLDETLIKARYKIFTQHYGALMRLKKLFPFHLINSLGQMDEVMRNIWREFEYQSSLELDQRTYDTIQVVPIASKIGVHARQNLVRRLEGYQSHNSTEFNAAIQMIMQRFVPEIERHAISGSSVVRVNSADLSSLMCVDIIMDILSERGYTVSVDSVTQCTPVRVNRETWQIENAEKTVYQFEVCAPSHQIRGVFDDATIRDVAGDVSITEQVDSNDGSSNDSMK